ncbi:hypothetical protein B566_EDAN003069, partial [Ephemera danica]
MIRGVAVTMRSQWIVILMLAFAIQHSSAQVWTTPFFKAPDQPQNGNVDFPDSTEYNGGNVVSGIYFDENVSDGTRINIGIATYTVWTAPYFRAPDQPENGNVYFPNATEYDGQNVVSGIYFDENVPNDIRINIGIATYTGSEKPDLTIVGGPAGDPLGLDSEQIQPSGEWRIFVTKTQDTETKASFSVQVMCDSTIGIMNLVVRNLNDEAPYIEAPNSCDVEETHPIDTDIPNCVIKINDRDGVEFGGSAMVLSVISADGI